MYKKEIASLHADPAGRVPTRIQSFVMTKICYQALPMPQFTTLQKRVFPAYFRIQLGLVVLTVVTFPTRSVLSLARAGWAFWVPLATNFGMAILNWWTYGPRTQEAMIKRTHQGWCHVFLSLCLSSPAMLAHHLVLAALLFLFFDPFSENQNHHLPDIWPWSCAGTETIDGRKCSDKENMSEDMRRVNRNFSHNHAMSIHLNFIGMLATVWYGFSLASKVTMAL